MRIVCRTQAGDDVVADSQKANYVAEQQWRDELGPARYDALKAALTDLGRGALRF